MAESAYKYDYGYSFNAAVKPQQEEKVNKQPKLEVIVNPYADRVARERETSKLAIKISAVFAVALVIFSVFCYSLVEMNKYKHELASKQTDLLVHQTKNQECKIKLNALVAGVDIEKYAVEKLGLIKVSAENEFYLGENEGNRMIYSVE